YAFSFPATAPTEIYTLSLHDALPISCRESSRLHGLPYGEQLQPHRSEHGLLWMPPDRMAEHDQDGREHTEPRYRGLFDLHVFDRSEEHTSELQSRGHLVCRLLLEKKK